MRRIAVMGRMGLAALVISLGVFSTAADETQDPIAKLKDRSANKRWTEARKEWLPFSVMRRRRQERQEEAAAAEAAETAQAPAPSAEPIFTPEAAPASPSEPIIAPRMQQGIATDRGPRTHGPAARKARRRAEIEANEAPAVSIAPPVEPPHIAPAEPTTTSIEDSLAGEGSFDWPAPISLRPQNSTTDEAPDAPDDPRLSIEPTHVAGMSRGAVDTALRMAPLRKIAATPASRSREIAQLVPSEPAPPVIEPTPAPIEESKPVLGEPTLAEDVPPAPEVDASELPLPRAERFVMPPEPLTNAPLRLRAISEIQPFRGYSPDGGPVRLCPPPEGLAADATPPRCPEEHELPLFGSLDRDFIGIEYCWQASNIFYRPLYFEDFALERYGHTYNEAVQSAVSIGKFGVQLLGLPYQMVLDKPDRKDYPLGYYRPGDCAPYKCYQIPLNAEAAAVTAGVYTGAAFLFH